MQKFDLQNKKIRSKIRYFFTAKLKKLAKLQKYASKYDGIELQLLGKPSACQKKQMLTKHKYYLEFTKIRSKIIPFSDRKSVQLPQKYLKIPENLTYQAASGNAVPKSVLNVTRVIKVTQTTKNIRGGNKI